MSNNNQLVKFKLPCKDWMWDVMVMCSEFTMAVGFILYVILLTLHFCRGLDEFLAISIEFVAHAFSVFVFMRLYVHKQCKVYKVVGREYNEYSNLLSLIVYSIVLENVCITSLIAILCDSVVFTLYEFMFGLVYVVLAIFLEIWSPDKGDSVTYDMYSSKTEGDLITSNCIYVKSSFVVEYGDKSVIIDLKTTNVYTLGRNKIIFKTNGVTNIVDWHEYAYIAIKKLDGSEDRWDYSSGKWHKIESVY